MSKHYNDEGFLVDEHGTHGLAGSLMCPCHDKNCEECCPCKAFGDCKECVKYYKIHKTPEQVMCEKIRDETLDEVVQLIEDLGWSASGWGHVINMINDQLRNKKVYCSITKDEMKIIQYTCIRQDSKRMCTSPTLCEYYNINAHACNFDVSKFIQSIIDRGEKHE
jgi:hypothetical protein